MERSLRKRAKEAANALKKHGDKDMKATDLVRNSTDEKIVVRLGKSDQKKVSVGKDVFGSAVLSKQKKEGGRTTTTKRSMSAMEEILFHQEKLKQKEAKEKKVVQKKKEEEEEKPWIAKDIVVRVLNRDLKRR